MFPCSQSNAGRATSSRRGKMISGFFITSHGDDVVRPWQGVGVAPAGHVPGSNTSWMAANVSFAHAGPIEVGAYQLLLNARSASALNQVSTVVPTAHQRTWPYVRDNASLCVAVDTRVYQQCVCLSLIVCCSSIFRPPLKTQRRSQTAGMVWWVPMQH